MSDNKYGPFFDILSFFIVNGDKVESNFHRPELAKTDAQFSEIFAREIARTGIDDPAFNRSETVKRITKLMADFGSILDIEFPGIKKQDPAYIEMLGVIEFFSLYIKTLPGKTQEDQIIPAAPTYLWGLTDAEIEKILETIIQADRESARLHFSGQKLKGKICMTKPFLIYTIGRLIAEKRIKISIGEAIDFLHNHFTKRDGNPYTKQSIRRYLESADQEKMGPLKATFFGDR